MGERDVLEKLLRVRGLERFAHPQRSRCSLATGCVSDGTGSRRNWPRADGPAGVGADSGADDTAGVGCEKTARDQNLVRTCSAPRSAPAGLFCGKSESAAVLHPMEP